MRLKPVHRFSEVLALFGGGFAHVEPYLRDRAVIGQQLLKLRHVEGFVGGRNWVTVAWDVSAGARLMPIDRRVVDAEFHSPTSTCIGELFHDILLIGRCINDVVACLRSVKHVEAVVVLGRYHDEPHARGFGQGNDGVGIEVRRIELTGESAVLVQRNGRIGHDLLAVTVIDLLALPNAAESRIQAEVDEQS